MRVDDVAHVVLVAGEVELHDAVGRDAVDELVRVEVVVEGRDEDVVDVEQQPAAGAPRQLGEELPLRHLGMGELDVGRHVLERERAAEIVLHVVDTRETT